MTTSTPRVFDIERIIQGFVLIHDSDVFKVAQLLIALVSILVIAYIFVVFVAGFFTEIIEEKNRLQALCAHDEIFNEEYDKEMTHANAIEYIKTKYGENALDNIESSVQTCQKLEARLHETLKNLRQLIHLFELEMIDKQTVKESIDSAGQLMIHCDREFKIYTNIFFLLSKEDSTYADEYSEVLEIHTEVLMLQKRINNICLALISHQE